MSNNYGADSIKVLKGLEAVRKRPGMYIGDTDDGSGLHHMIFEVADNSVDEALAGYCSKILITLEADGSVSVEDDGRGVPVEMHKEQGVSAAEVIMTQLHAGGKFDQDSYKISGGLHGVGVSVVNALSSSLELRIWRDLKEHKMHFADGVATTSLEVVGPATKRGTYVRFKPSEEIFSHTIFDLSILEKRFRELAFLNKGIHFVLCDKREGSNKEISFHSEGGLSEFILYLNRSKSSLHQEVLSFEASEKHIQVEGALQWTESYHENVLCFTNNIPQSDGGTHLSGFRAGLTRLMTKLFEEKISEKKAKLGIQGDDVREGLTGIISVKLPDPKFSAQTKSKLVSSEVRAVVESVLVDRLERAFNEDPSLLKLVLDKAMQAASAREAAKRARELTRKKATIEISSLSGKLADCQSKKPEEKELYIVEGDSAGSTAKEGRDRKYQAILPMKGKILNVERARFDRVLGSAEIGSLIVALGAGIGVEDFNIEKIRYHKIVLMTDADVDGCHIRTLLLTFFYRHMPEVIERGYLYVAQPPLYRISKGKQEWYLKNDEAFDAFLLDQAKQYRVFVDDQEQEYDVVSLLALSMKWREILRGLGFGAHNMWYEYAVLAGVPQALTHSEGEGYALPVDVRDRFLSYIKKFDSSVKDVRVQTEGLVIVQDVYGSEVFQNILFSSLWHLRLDLTTFQPLLQILQPGKSLAVMISGKSYAFNTMAGLFNSVNDAIKGTMQVQRYKGLGEMNPDQLWDTTLNPDKRTLLQVKVGDVKEETDEVFSRLMGDVVEPRRRFIQDNALLVKSLDV